MKDYRPYDARHRPQDFVRIHEADLADLITMISRCIPRVEPKLADEISGLLMKRSVP